MAGSGRFWQRRLCVFSRSRIAAAMLMGLLVFGHACPGAADDIACVGDCNGDGQVDVAEVITGVNQTLGNTPLDVCPAFDCEEEGYVTIYCIVSALNAVLNGCPRPVNADVCSDAPPIDPMFSLSSSSLITGESSLDTTAATTDPTDIPTACACSQNSHTVWYRFQPQSDGIASVDTSGSDYSTVLAAFTGECGALTALTCGSVHDAQQPRISFPVAVGGTYLLEVAAACQSNGGLLQLGVDICGDGTTSLREECDDGNTAGGDGCDARCVYEGLGGIDQRWLGPPLALCGVSNPVFSIPGSPSSGQEFTPTQPTLAAVDVLVGDERVPGQPPEHYTLTIREATIDGPVVGSASAPVTFSGFQRQFWLHFTFGTSLSVTPGTRYVIELRAPFQSALWWLTSPDNQCATVPHYPDGDAILYGTPRPGSSFLFRTYAAKAARSTTP